MSAIFLVSLDGDKTFYDYIIRSRTDDTPLACKFLQLIHAINSNGLNVESITALYNSELDRNTIIGCKVKLKRGETYANLLADMVPINKVTEIKKYAKALAATNKSIFDLGLVSESGFTDDVSLEIDSLDFVF